MNRQWLFIASCVALAATSMSFSIRGDIMGAFEEDFVRPYVTESGATAEEGEALIKTNLGIIAGAAFFSFGLAILFGGPLVDLLGMGRLLWLAAICHIGGTFMTIFAPHFWVVVAATLIIGVGNGIVEAVCNPLIATMYPKEKTKKLTLFHAWFPGGVVIGGVLSYFFSQIGWGWELKMALLLVPSVIYAGMLIGQTFPPTERVAAGVSFGDMFRQVLIRPLFWVIMAVMILTAASELGIGQWLANVYNDVMAGDMEAATAGILFLCWGNGLMFILRQFFGGVAHRIAPVTLIMVTAPFAAAGMYLCGEADSALTWFVASGLIYFGVAFWWPSMLGIASERFPRTGALGLALVGGIGCFSTSAAGPALGYLNDNYGPEKAIQLWGALPVIIFLVFLLIFLYDMSRGGYKAEELVTVPEDKAERIEEEVEQQPQQ